jgi:hypothetical protein
MTLTANTFYNWIQHSEKERVLKVFFDLKIQIMGLYKFIVKQARVSVQAQKTFIKRNGKQWIKW